MVGGQTLDMQWEQDTRHCRSVCFTFMHSWARWFLLAHVAAPALRREEDFSRQSFQRQ